MPLRVGDIVHITGLLSAHPDKGKYCVCITVGPNQFLLVNTENRAMYDCIPFDKKGRDFPRHDSFIGCKNIFTAETEQIESQHGLVDDAELATIRDKIRNSPFIPKVQIDPIVAAIEAEITLRASVSK